VNPELKKVDDRKLLPFGHGKARSELVLRD
jgi:hypothetical protein